MNRNLFFKLGAVALLILLFARRRRQRRMFT